MRESTKVEAFLLLFNIKDCPEMDCYMQGWDGERGIRITDIALRKIKELYFYLKKDTTSIKSLGTRYFPMGIEKEFIKRVSEINVEISKEGLHVLRSTIKDLQHFESFEAATRPLMRYIGSVHHPHVSAIVTSNRSELVEGLKVLNTDDYIKGLPKKTKTI